MPPLPKARALKRDGNVGLDLELQLGGQAGRWGGGAADQACQFTAGAGRAVLGYMPRGRSPCTFWAWAVRMASDVTPTLPFTNLPSTGPVPCPKGGSTCKNRAVTHTLSPTQPVGTRAHCHPRSAKTRAARQINHRGADSALLDRPCLFNLQHPTHVRPPIIEPPTQTEPQPQLPRRQPRAPRCSTLLRPTVSEAFATRPTQLAGPGHVNNASR